MSDIIQEVRCEMKRFFCFLLCLVVFCVVGLSTVYAAKDPISEQVGPGSVVQFFQSSGGGAAAILVKEWMSGSLYMKLIHTLLVLVIGYLLMLFVVRFTNKRIKDVKARHVVRKNIMYSITALMILVIIFLWAHKMNSLTLFIGLASAGIALALQEALLCVAGWFLIVFRHPFAVGDRVEFGGVKGDVIDIRLFQTSLLEIDNWVHADQSTGRIANVPNSLVFKRELFNYNQGFEYIWNEIKIMLTFESDWKRAEEIMVTHGNAVASGMEEEVKRKIDHMTSKFMIFYDKLTPIVYTDIKESGVEMSLRYLTQAKRRRSTHDQLCRAILSDFGQEEHVNFAYTTYRIVKS